MKILISNDDTDPSTNYKSVLERLRHEVIITNTAEDCLKLYYKELQSIYFKTDAVEHKQPFDVIILDYKIPHIHGIEVAEEILAVNPLQRIIFVSEYDNYILIDSLRRLKEPIEVLQKPFSDKSLINIIEQEDIYLEFERLKINTRYIKFANFRHEQIREMLDILKRSRKQNKEEEEEQS
jgi:CheY-like chemotaxis protein